MVVYEKLKNVNLGETKMLENDGGIVYYVEGFINVNGKICVSEAGARIILLPNSFIFFNKPSTLVGLGEKKCITPTLFFEGQKILGTPLPNINYNEVYAGIELNINMNFNNLNLEFYKLGGNDYKSQSGIIDIFPALRIITRYLETKENKKLKLNNVTLNQCNDGLQVIILNNYLRKDLITECFIDNFIYNSNIVNNAVYCSQIININDQKLNTPNGLIMNNASITNGYLECLWINAIINHLEVNIENLNPLLQKAVLNFDTLGKLFINLSLYIRSLLALLNLNTAITLNIYVYNEITNYGLYTLGTNNLIFNKGSKINYLSIRQDADVALKTVFIENDTQIPRATTNIFGSINVAKNNFSPNATSYATSSLVGKCESCIKNNKTNLCNNCASKKSSLSSKKVCTGLIIDLGFVSYNFNNCPNPP